MNAKEIFTMYCQKKRLFIQPFLADFWVICLCRGSFFSAEVFEKLGDPAPIFRFSGFLGQNGAHETVWEGSCRTPIGLFRLTEGFYQGKKPKTDWPLFAVTPQTYWIDDPSSLFYNRPITQEGPPRCSCEAMADYPEYSCGFGFSYNRFPPLPGRGSAFFFHCGDHPTHGCLAAEKPTVLALLSQLSETKKPKLAILKREE